MDTIEVGTNGKCARLEYLEIECGRIPQDKEVVGTMNDVIPLDLKCVACMINSTYTDLSERLLGIEDKLGIVG